MFYDNIKLNAGGNRKALNRVGIKFLNFYVMSKLSMDALKERTDALTSDELLKSISGGTENDCHVNPDLIWMEIGAQQ